MMKSYLHTIVSTIFACGFALLSFGQTKSFDPYYSISRLTPDDGLSQGSNYFRFEDSRGFMWLTGNDALNRYDGSMVKVYNLDRYFDNCPPLQQGYGFAEDGNTNIYIGSVNGLYTYHRDKEKFTLQNIFPHSPDKVAMPFACKNGKIWCFNKEYEIASIDVQTHIITYYDGVTLPRISSVHIYDMEGSILYYRWPFFDKNDNIWFTGIKNVLKYNVESRSSTMIFSEASPKNNFQFSLCSYDQDRNRIYFGTTNGLLIYNIDNNQQQQIVAVGNHTLGWISNFAISNNLVAIRSKFSLFFTDSSLTKLLDLSQGKNIYYRTNGYGFDHSGRLWMCDDGLGQLIFDFKEKLFHKEPNENSSINYFKETGVSNFSEFANGDIFLRDDIIQDYKSKKLTQVTFSNNKNENFPFRTQTDSLRKGIWLYGAQSDYTRIMFIDQQKRSKRVLETRNLKNQGHILDLEVLPNGKIICATSEGLFWLNETEKKLDKISNLTVNNAFKINLLSRNRCAVSFLNNNMLLLKVNQDNSLETIKTILPGIQSFYLSEDPVRKHYWLGSNQGVYLLDDSFGMVKKFDANTGLAGTYIYGLLLDSNGNAWCSHQHGLSSINTNTFQIINYTKADGIQDWDFNNRAFYKSTDGTLYFGGVKGFNYFKPPVTTPTYYKPEIYVNEIRVNNQLYLQDSSANMIDLMNLSAGQSDLSFHAILKDLDNNDEHQVFYHLIGDEWMLTSNNNHITFNNLAPGKYILEIAVYNKFSNQLETQKSISVYIATPFYKAIWFWVLIFVLLTIAVLWRRNQIKLAKQKQEYEQQLALDGQRLKITADLHDDIGASLSSLQVNSAVANKLVKSDPGKAQEVMAKIELQSQRLSENIGDIIWSMKPGKSEFMSLSTRIKNFATDILGSTNINYSIHIDDECDILLKDFTARKNVLLIIKEAVNNAVKYSHATMLEIGLHIRNNQVTILVEDNGVGMSEEQRKGNGIDNMKSRAEELHGSCTINSVKNTGVTICAIFPVP